MTTLRRSPPPAKELEKRIRSQAISDDLRRFVESMLGKPRKKKRVSKKKLKSVLNRVTLALRRLDEVLPGPHRRRARGLVEAAGLAVGRVAKLYAVQTDDY